jgi:selenocysteine lyase/cysteine desulfurase
MPDRFEPGSHNTIGIAGLSEGAAWLLERGVESVRAHEEALMREFLGVLTPEAMGRAGLRLLGPRDIGRRVGVFALVHEAIGSEVFAQRLEAEFGVLVRAGLHCAPLAHRTFGTDPEHAAEAGAFRISFGPFVSVEEARFAGEAVLRVARNHRPGAGATGAIDVRTAAPRSTAARRGTLA